jgi:hypothetical protein
MTTGTARHSFSWGRDVTVLRRLGVGLTIVVASGQSALAQQASSSPGACVRQTDEYLPAFPLRQVIEKPPYDSVAVLTALRNKCWQTAIKTYLGNYQRPLPAWGVGTDLRF